MEEREITEEPRIAPKGAAQQLRTVLALAMILIWVLHAATAHGDEKPCDFRIDPGDASLMLNEFSRQSDLQILFDFNKLRGKKTNAVVGTYLPNDALVMMLKGTGLIFDYVNTRTLAVTPNAPPGEAPQTRGSIRRWFQHFRERLHRPASANGPDVVLILGRALEGEDPPPGAQVKQYDRSDIERSGTATTADFLSTIPQIFGGGPAESTVLGREQASNTALGVGVNYRGLGAGSTIPLINGRPIAPSGSTGAFADVSNIPLSALDHIDTISESGSTPYGSRAVGGIVNFVMRERFEGAETLARTGTANGGALAERQVGQLFGARWGDASAVLALEYYRRGSLPASDRAQATSNLLPFGGSNFDTPYGNPGTIISGPLSWAIPHGQTGESLNTGQLTAGTQNLHDQYQGATILPELDRVNVYANSKLPITENTQLYIDALFGNRRFTQYSAGQAAVLLVPTSNPFYIDPTHSNAPVQVDYGFGADLGSQKFTGSVNTGNFALGLSRATANGWNVTGQIAYTFEHQENRLDGLADFAALNAALADPNPLTAFNPFGDGSYTNPATLASIRAQYQYHASSAVWQMRGNASRSVWTLPGGDLQLLAGADIQHQTLDTSAFSPSVATVTRLSRNAFTGFAELRIPIVGESNRMTGVRRLDASLAERFERYSDVGNVTNPTITVRWLPVDSLTFRASVARFFKPPNLGDLSQVTNGSEFLMLPDLQSSSGATTALVAYGGNRSLRPEEARSWAVGIDFNPPAIPGLSIALSQYNAHIRGRVDSIPLSSDVLTNPLYADFIIRNPTAQQRAAVCQQGGFVGDIQSCLTAPIGAIVDTRLLNIDSIDTRGVDILAKYTKWTRAGRFDFGLDGTYIFRYALAETPTGPLQDLVNTEHNPLRARFRGSVGYVLRGFGTTASVNYSGSYTDTASAPERPVAAWTTLDLQLSYEFGFESQGATGGVRLSLNAQNVFAAKPPFLNSQVGIGYDQENGSLRGRQLSVGLRKRW